MNDVPVYSYFLDFESVLDKLGLRDEWQELVEENGGEYPQSNHDFYELVEGTEFFQKLRNSIPVPFDFVIVDGGMGVDTSCAEYVEAGKAYLDIFQEDLFEVRPLPVFHDLQEQGLEPKWDNFVITV